MNVKGGATLGAVAIVAAGVLGQPPRTLAPVDEGAKNETFARFRNELIAIVRARDAGALAASLDPEIRVTFGEKAGVQAFLDEWHPGRPDSRLWPELARVLDLGGKFLGNEFCAPYVYAAFPAAIDPFFHSALIGADVPLRASPDRDSPIVARLGYEIVGVEPGSRSEPSPWVAVSRPQPPSTGYVPREWVRSPIDYRACFAQRGGKWLMTSFIAGD